MAEQYGTVVRTEQLTPRLVRVVFGGEGLSSFTPTEFTDQYVNALFVPDRADGAPPRGRRETVRWWDAGTGELAIDFVTHGDDGYAGKWANHATEGDRLELVGPSGGYAPRPDAAWHLLVGDESALPAIGAALDALAPSARAVVVAVVDDPDHELALTSPAQVDLTWVHRAAHHGDGDALLHAVEDLTFPPGEPHAFVHGEAGEVRSIRKHLLTERGLPKEGQSISPYWRRAHTDEQWREVKRDWLAASELDA